MVNDLVRDAAVVLQHVVVGRARSGGQLLDNDEDLAEVLVGDVLEGLAVVLGDDEL